MPYINDDRFTPDLVNLLFEFRTRMYNVKNNFRNNYKQTNILCPLCKVHDGIKPHLFECTVILQQLQNKIFTKYDDIFSSDTDTLLNVSKELKEIIKVREDLQEENSIVPGDWYDVV